MSVISVSVFYINYAAVSVCLPLLIFPCTIRSRISLLAPAHPGGPGKRAVKWLWWYAGNVSLLVFSVFFGLTKNFFLKCLKRN